MFASMLSLLYAFSTTLFNIFLSAIMDIISTFFTLARSIRTLLAPCERSGDERSESQRKGRS